MGWAFQIDNDIQTLDDQITSDPSYLVTALPGISLAIEELALLDPEQCAFLWDRLKPLIVEVLRRRDEISLQKSMKSSVRGGSETGEERPKSPVCPQKNYSFTNIHGEERWGI